MPRINVKIDKMTPEIRKAIESLVSHKGVVIEFPIETLPVDTYFGEPGPTKEEMKCYTIDYLAKKCEDMSISEIIRDRRTLLKVTQQDLSDITGLSPQTISNIERGKVDPSFSNLQKIVYAVGLKITAVVKQTI